MCRLYTRTTRLQTCAENTNVLEPARVPPGPAFAIVCYTDYCGICGLRTLVLRLLSQVSKRPGGTRPRGASRWQATERNKCACVASPALSKEYWRARSLYFYLVHACDEDILIPPMHQLLINGWRSSATDQPSSKTDQQKLHM
jgi:hypothetical protein|eukprot:7381912-Prymnesium_polylepis.2